jgi:hypothetical protein
MKAVAGATPIVFMIAEDPVRAGLASPAVCSRVSAPGGPSGHAPDKLELVLNMKTANALRVEVPLHLQQLADEVIE